eukprot:438921-Pyramimonas_sp.AAC.1
MEAPHLHTASPPQLHKLYTIGRPVALSASRMRLYACAGMRSSGDRSTCSGNDIGCVFPAHRSGTSV